MRASALRPGFLSLGLSVFGIVSLGYLFGAAVMFFDLPSSGLLHKAFLGGRAWNERRQVISHNSEEKSAPTVKGGGIDKPGKTSDGYTLCTLVSLSASNTRAFLLDMQGKEVHSWEIPFSQVWPDPPHITAAVHDRLVCAFGCHPFPNGDLLVVFHGLEHSPNGYGLAKLDKDSNVLWKYSAKVHHDVDVGEDGTIYAITHEMAREKPSGLDYVPSECLVDHLVLLSPEGKESAHRSRSLRHSKTRCTRRCSRRSRTRPGGSGSLSVRPPTSRTRTM